MSIGRVLRGSIWLSIGFILSNFFSFIYWLFISRVISPEVVGKVAVILGVESLTLAILNLGIPMGVQRFLGRSYGRNDLRSLAEYFYTSALFLIVISLGAVYIIMSIGGITILSLDPTMLLFIGILTILGWLNGWPIGGFSLLNSILRTEYI